MEGGAATYGNQVTSLVTASLTTETNLVMLERADLSKVLNEQAFGISGMVSADAAAKIGQVTGVKVLVAGLVINTGGDRLTIVASIIGTESGRLFALETGLPRGGLLTGRANVELKIQERRTGDIIGFDSQESTATDIGIATASNAAKIKAADGLAERILPLLAK
jgi:hypothetical protein